MYTSKEHSSHLILLGSGAEGLLVIGRKSGGNFADKQCSRSQGSEMRLVFARYRI